MIATAMRGFSLPPAGSGAAARDTGQILPLTLPFNHFG